MSIRAAFLTSFVRRGGLAVLQFIASIVIARLLPPAEMGVFLVALALLAVLAALREMGATRYIIKEVDLTDSKVRTIFGFSLLVGWGLAILIWLGRQPIADFYAEPRMAAILAVLAVNFVLLPIGLPALALMRRERRYAELSVIELVATAAGISTSVFLAWRGHGAIALAWGSLIQTSAMVGLALGRRPDHIRLMPSLKEWRSVGAFSGVASAETLIVTLGKQLPQILMGKAFGFAEVGLYVRGDRLAGMVRSQFIGSINWVTGAEFGQRHRDGHDLVMLVARITDYSLVISWPVLIFLGLKAEAILYVLFGANWVGAAPILTILCLAQAIHVIYGQAQSIYEATGDVRLKFRNELVLQGLSVGLLLLALPFGLLAVAWSRVALAALSLAMHQSVFRKYVAIDARRLLSIARPGLIVAAIFATLLLALDTAMTRQTSNAFYVVGIEGITMALLFPALLMLLKHGLFAELKRVLAGRFGFGR